MATGNPPPTPPKGGFEGIERAIEQLKQDLARLEREVFKAKHDYGS